MRRSERGSTAGTMSTGRIEAFSDGAFAILFNIVWRYASSGGRQLREDADPRFVRQISRGYLLGPPLYFAGFLLSLVNVSLSLALYIGLALFFSLPIVGNERHE